jgi:hypothetical protein
MVGNDIYKMGKIAMLGSSGSCPVVILPNFRRVKNTLLYIIYYFLYLLSGSSGSSLVVMEKSVDILYRAKRTVSTTGLPETIARGQKEFILDNRNYRARPRDNRNRHPGTGIDKQRCMICIERIT